MRSDVLVTCRCGAGDLDILPYWLGHYSGFRNLVSFMVEGEEEWPSHYDGLEFWCEHRVERYRHDETIRLWKGDVLRYCAEHREVKWVISVDADEFLVGPERVVDECEERGGWAGAVMVDRFAAGGYLDVPCGGPMREVFPLAAGYVGPVMNGCTYKTVVTVPEQACMVHGSPVGGRLGPLKQIDHFKWREGTLGRLEKRAADCDAAGVPWGAGVRKVLDLVKRDAEERPYLEVEPYLL